MSKAISHSGSLTTDGTEQTIGAVYTDGKMRLLWLSMVNMAIGDQFRIRIYSTINGVSGVVRDFYLQDANASEPHIPIHLGSNMTSYHVTITRISATNRAFGYQIETLE